MTALSRIGDVSDLPEELKEMIVESPSRRSGMQDKVEQVIVNFGGSATLSEIIVGLYREFGIVVKSRANVTQLLLSYRNKGGLEKNGKHFSLPGQAPAIDIEINGEDL